jgi:putative DNA primase/helicase
VTFDEIVQHFPGGKMTPRGEYEVRCTGHEDRRASLGIRAGRNGGVVMKCQAGCPNERVLSAVGLSLADLAPPSAARLNGHVTHGETVYVYTDEQGEGLFEVVRTVDKHFWQRLPGQEKGGIGKARRVLFGLPDLLKTPANQPVFIVEGEKDCWRLFKLGLTATTNPGGAGKWLQAYTDWLQERLPSHKFVILADNDEPGIKHADEVLASLLGVGLEARSVLLPGLPPKGDVSDWLTAGKAKEDLLEAIKPTPHPLDLKVLDGRQLEQEVIPVPEAIIPHLLYRGFVTLLAGDSKLGKSSLELRAILAACTGGWWLDRECRSENRLPESRILYVNFEDPLFVTRDRAQRMMAPEKLPRNFLTMPPPYGTSLSGFLDWLHGAYERLAIDAVVLDPIAIAAEWTDETDNAEVARTLKPLGRLAAETMLSILLAHHVTKKPGQYGLNIRGASAIKANVLGYLVLEREKELFKLSGINKLSGPWDVTLDRTDRDWSWWIVESRTGHTRTAHQARKEEAMADLLSLIGEAPLQTTERLAELLQLNERTCRRYLAELEEMGHLFAHELPQRGREGRRETGWILASCGQNPVADS